MEGLRDRHVVERLVREGRPTSFAQAMMSVQEHEADDYRLDLALDETVDGLARGTNGDWCVSQVLQDFIHTCK